MTTTMDIHEAFDLVGHFGRGQVRMYAMTWVPCVVFTPMLVLASVFNQYELKEQPCTSTMNPNSTSNSTEICHEDPPFYSFAVEYPEVTSTQIHTITAGFMAGVASGSLFFGMLSDRIGQQKTLFITTLSALLTIGLSGALTFGFRSYTVWRFFTGFSRGGFNVAMSTITYLLWLLLSEMMKKCLIIACNKFVSLRLS